MQPHWSSWPVFFAPLHFVVLNIEFRCNACLGMCVSLKRRTHFLDYYLVSNLPFSFCRSKPSALSFCLNVRFMLGGRLSTTRGWYMLCSALFFHGVLCPVVGYRPPGNGLLCSALCFHCAFHVGYRPPGNVVRHAQQCFLTLRSISLWIAESN